VFRGEPIRGEARSALDEELRRHGSAEVMCLAVDTEGCLNSISWWTELPLSLVAEASTDPLVIVVR
jgi:hypothetical protein